MARTRRSTSPSEGSSADTEATATDAAAADSAPTATEAAADSAPTATEAAAGDAAPPDRRRVFVTGGAGFVGRAVVQALLDRGDHVVAAVRDPARARDLAEAGADVVEDDLSSVARLADAMGDVDAAIHAAGSYRIGITKAERGAMWDANVGTTTRMLDAAEVAGLARLVYVSTVGVFGNTKGQVVDETFRRDLADGFLSWYDETKYGAHEVAEQRMAAGLPAVIVQPSQVYGPRDPSGFGQQLRLASNGRLRYRALDELGVGLVHVDDLAAGIVAALDRGRVGEAYVLSGPRTTFGDAIRLAASGAGRRPPRLRIPTRLLRLAAPAGRLVGQPNLREVVAASAGVTYWASADKAERELGFRARPLEDGFRDVFGSR